MTLSGVSVTAVAVAAARALETTRPRPLMRDPYAARLVRASGVEVPFPSAWPEDADRLDPFERAILLGAHYIGLRTRFIDDEVMGTPLPQTVFLGSGLDTRPWRLPWSDYAAVITLDSADVVTFMTTEMAGVRPPSRFAMVAADVTAPWTRDLVKTGFRPDLPTRWVLEGLLPYLGADDQLALFDDIAFLSARTSRIVLERAVALDTSEDASERLEEFSALTGLPLDEVLARSHPPDACDVLAGHGWFAEEIDLDALVLAYDRPLVLGAGDVLAMPRGGFVTGVF